MEDYQMEETLLNEQDLKQKNTLNILQFKLKDKF